MNFCTLLQKEPVSLNELDVEQTLARLTAKEEQGVSFVDIEQADRKAERVRGALVGGRAVYGADAAVIMGIMAWASCVDPEEAAAAAAAGGAGSASRRGCIIGTLKVLVDRLKEIGKGRRRCLS